MDAVALISGGKDSCFSIAKAKAFGVRVVVLAHIEPPCDHHEPDSMMYQSVGSTAVPHIAAALRLPLVTRKTHAVAKTTNLTYRPTPGDEVEDLVALLTDVTSRFPTVRAVISGALWSDYQRLRVESAASRTGLLSIAPLWRRQQSQLLDEMIASGVDAVLIKVAGVGLNDTHLGKSLKEMRPLLHKLDTLYGSHICGEGGEYETFVRWMPGFQHRIDLTETETVIHSNDPVAPVSFLLLKSVSANSVTPATKDGFSPVLANRPEVFQFDPEFYTSQQLNDSNGATGNSSSATISSKSIGETSDFLHLVLFSDDASANGVRDVCSQMRDVLSDRNLSITCVVTIMLYLEDVHGSKYVEANEAYKETFGTSETVVPPVRACVGLGRGNCGTTIEVLLRKGSRDGAVPLHVQSLSEWAPPCIGPYAQFVEEDDVVYVSGAIPLFPATASIPKGMPIGNQIQACFGNIRKTLEAGSTKIENICLFIVYVTSEYFAEKVDHHLSQILSEEENIKVIVPVGSLPKDAFVEVKAFGVLSDSAPRHLTRSGDRSTSEEEKISCGKFTFIKLTSWADGNKLDEIITAKTNGLGPLAIQIYYDASLDMEHQVNSLRERLSSTSVLRFTSEWMPSQRRWIAIITSLY